MEALINKLARQVQNKYYGKYRGFIKDNQDPEKMGRVRVIVPSVLGETVTGWALPCLPFGGLPDQGFFMVPELDAQVWIEFEEGNLSQPLWTGTFWQKSGDIPAEADKTEPTTRVIKTPSGHALQFDDEAGAEKIRLHHSCDAEFNMDENGTVNLSDASGNKVVLDANTNKVVIEDCNGNTLILDSKGTVVEDKNGNKIEMAASGVTVKGTNIVVQGDLVSLGGSSGEPLIKGTSFLSLFATHIHTCGAAGSPSSPPIPQGEASSLSSTVMTK